MFPLGMVLFPQVILPLNIFEPRYLKMLGYCLDHEPAFGVVLITRGQETGGGEQRASVGTLSRIIDATSSPDGRCELRTKGIRRIRITAWYPDAPFPQAEVEDWPDEIFGVTLTTDPERVLHKLGRLRSAIRQLSGFGPDPAQEISADPVEASYQAASLAPLDTHDQFRLLSANGPAERWALLDEMLDEQIDILRFTHGTDSI
jgi:uncharacterized protein